MKNTPPLGMKDYLPAEAALRDYVMDKITSVYKVNGFEKIITPAVEAIENLYNSDGGDNLKLIYKIMKRGDKLADAVSNLTSTSMNSLSDLGLRYDLTLPLARYYSNNSAKLPNPFKCIQIDKVYRAERAQRGRMREFVQCDIDIIGSNSIDSEIELILVTSRALNALGIDDFKIKINSRVLIQNVIMQVGFALEEVNSICISIDKMDKIGFNGVESELKEKGLDCNAINSLIEILSNNNLRDFINYDGAIDIINIIDSINQISDDKIKIDFDLTLVRGQGYYTGCIFEIISSEFGGSIAGGGRYDNLIELFNGQHTPAVGFSIGFERIFTILYERGVKVNCEKSVAIVYDDGEFIQAMKYTKVLQNRYTVILVHKKNKLGKQLQQLKNRDIEYVVILSESIELKKL